MNKIRLYENFHIVLWLIKDSCWLMQWKWLGTLMAVPTLGMALYICWKTRHHKGHFIPNVAVSFWLGANITWMMGEFYDFPFTIPAVCLFSSGLVVIGIYFLRYKGVKGRSQGS